VCKGLWVCALRGVWVHVRSYSSLAAMEHLTCSLPFAALLLCPPPHTSLHMHMHAHAHGTRTGTLACTYTYNCTRTRARRQPACAEVMVVNISSLSAQQPHEAFGVYGAGKAARHMLTGKRQEERALEKKQQERALVESQEEHAQEKERRGCVGNAGNCCKHAFLEERDRPPRKHCLAAASTATFLHPVTHPRPPPPLSSCSCAGARG